MLCAVLSLGLLSLVLQIGIKELTSLHYIKGFISGVSVRKQLGLWLMVFGWMVIPNSAQLTASTGFSLPYLTQKISNKTMLKF